MARERKKRKAVKKEKGSKAREQDDDACSASNPAVYPNIWSYGTIEMLCLDKFCHGSSSLIIEPSMVLILLNISLIEADAF